ncbi:hypothetical protein NEF87_000030 [Candidatus Lokiarchaeum ossiferum]|uniref:Uncharacterized protein n=1 Tax=Candidatus Lokiarchaeum ossiferum TaxID=2951803 RepID=A0ABY6HK32_9ARCH|nr:hypothetical protein NEF87_000030 [Candidatus Lokiarchaeum sp. B-35]
MTATFIAANASTLDKQPMIQAFISFCLRNHIPINIIAHQVELLTTELNQLKSLTQHQIQQKLIKFLPKDLQKSTQNIALLEGKTQIDIIMAEFS